MITSWLGLFVAGLATFVSPCVLPLAPILVASWSTSGQGRLARVYSTLWFVAGFTMAFVALGSGATALATVLAPVKPILFLIAATILAVFGLRMLGVIEAKGVFGWLNRTWSMPDVSKRVPRSIGGLVFGLVFGLGWTPCVGPILGGVLTYVASKESSPIRGALMLFVFSMGIGLPLLALSVFFERASGALGRLRKWIPKLEAATGFGLVIFAVLLVNQVRFTPPSGGEISSVAATDQHGELLSLGSNESGLSRMVFFYSENCPTCHAMESFLSGFEKDCSSAGFRFSKINVDQASNSAAASRFNVRAVPTISVLAPDGHELVHLVGYQTEGRLREAARTTTSALCKADPQEGLPPLLPPEQSCKVGKKC